MENQPTQPSNNEPLPPVAPVGFSASQPIAPKSRKKLFLVGGIIAAVLVTIGGGSALAYNFWYQNPEKVVTDGIINALKAETVTFTGSASSSATSKLQVKFDGKFTRSAGSIHAAAIFTSDDKDYQIGADGLLDESQTPYVKVDGLTKIVESYGDELPVSTKKAVDQLLAKIDNEWIKIESDDIDDLSKDTAKLQRCFSETTKKFKEDSSMSAELGSLYSKHRFIIIKQKLGEKDGSLGYVIGNNPKAEKAFTAGLKDTKLYKELHNCDSSFTIDEDSSDESDDDLSTVRVWVTKWGHEVTKLETETKGTDATGTFVIEPRFNLPVKITAPTKFTTVKQMKADIEDILLSFGTTPEPISEFNEI